MKDVWIRISCPKCNISNWLHRGKESIINSQVYVGLTKVKCWYCGNIWQEQYSPFDFCEKGKVSVNESI